MRENPRNTDALNLMGVLAIEANRNDFALEYFSNAVKLAPHIAMYRNNFGNALLVADKPDEALPHLQKAVQIDATYVDALCNLGKAYRSTGEMQQSAEWYKKALVVAPGFLTARSGLADIESEFGRFENAIFEFKAILDQDPVNVEALCGLALAQKFDADDTLIPRFESLLNSQSLRADYRAPLHHAFAKVCNDVGRFDDAFQHFTIGKTYKNTQFDPTRLEEGYTSLAELFTPAFYAERQGWGSPDERPVFVVGLPRSGTTLTEQILASHPDVAGLGELPDMRKLAQMLDFGNGAPTNFASRLRRLKKADVHRLAATYLKAYARSNKPHAIRMVDKSPHNYELLGLIALLFPRAHVLHCRRQPLDNCVAIYMQNFNDSHGYNRSLKDLGRYWRAYRFLVEKLAAQVPLAVTPIDYEMTVAEPEAAARHILSTAQIDWDDACLRFYETDRAVRTPSRWQVRQPIYSSSVDRWKRYEKHLGPLRDELKKNGMGT